MGMESFFVNVLPMDMEIHMSDGIGYIKGDSKIYELDWKNKLTLKSYYLLELLDKQKFYVIDDYIELYVEQTSENGTYLTIVGGFYCFTYALKLMNRLIKDIYDITKQVPKIFACGEVFKYNENKFIDIITDGYNEKNKI